MSTPIDTLLDQIEYEPILQPGVEYELHATHRGVLRIGEMELTVYRLSDGSRVIDQESIMQFLEMLTDGENPDEN